MYFAYTSVSSASICRYAVDCSPKQLRHSEDAAAELHTVRRCRTAAHLDAVLLYFACTPIRSASVCRCAVDCRLPSDKDSHAWRGQPTAVEDTTTACAACSSERISRRQLCRRRHSHVVPLSSALAQIARALLDLAQTRITSALPHVLHSSMTGPGELHLTEHAGARSS